MSMNLRINDEQHEAVRNKAIKINKELILLGKEPIRDSKLLHLIITLGVDLIDVLPNGEIGIKPKT